MEGMEVVALEVRSFADNDAWQKRNVGLSADEAMREGAWLRSQCSLYFQKPSKKSGSFRQPENF